MAEGQTADSWLGSSVGTLWVSLAQELTLRVGGAMSTAVCYRGREGSHMAKIRRVSFRGKILWTVV